MNVKKNKHLSVLLVLILFSAIFPLKLFSQAIRSGVTIEYGMAHPGRLDSFNFTYGGEKYHVKKDSKGYGSFIGIGFNLKFGYQRHYLVFEPGIRFYDQNYLLNMDSLDLWSVDDSVKFGISESSFNFKVLYNYKFKIRRANFGLAMGANYVLPHFEIRDKSFMSSGDTDTDIEVDDIGLASLLEKTYNENAHLYAIVGLDYEPFDFLTVGFRWHQRVNEIYDNVPKFFYSIYANYSLPLTKVKKDIYIDKSNW